jgi:hypothetical protein
LIKILITDNYSTTVIPRNIYEVNMIAEPTVQATMAAVYGSAAVISYAVARRAERTVRVYAYIVVGVIAVSAMGTGLTAAGVGQLPALFAEDGSTSIPSFIDDSIAYGVLFGLTTFFAGASRGMIAVVAGLSFGSRLVIELGVQFGPTVTVVGILISIATYLARAYLLWGPVWNTAQSASDRRQLLFRKSRNLLMLLMGANILAIPLIVAGMLDPFVQLIVLNYVDILIRVGFVGFLLANIGALTSETEMMTEPHSTNHETATEG